jgi:hypothetical protein
MVLFKLSWLSRLCSNFRYLYCRVDRKRSSLIFMKGKSTISEDKVLIILLRSVYRGHRVVSECVQEHDDRIKRLSNNQSNDDDSAYSSVSLFSLRTFILMRMSLSEVAIGPFFLFTFSSWLDPLGSVPVKQIKECQRLPPPAPCNCPDRLRPLGPAAAYDGGGGEWRERGRAAAWHQQRQLPRMARAAIAGITGCCWLGSCTWL